MIVRQENSKIQNPTAICLAGFKNAKDFYTCTFALLLWICFLVPLAEAQTPQNLLVQNLDKAPDEPAKPAIKIEVKGGFLSVEIVDAQFGNVIKAIAEKAKFRVEISSNVTYKQISTSFKDVDIEKGIRRLLNIIKEKDYTISYTPQGLIDRLAIYGVADHKPAGGTPQKRTEAIQRLGSPVPMQPSRPIQPVQPPRILPRQPQPEMPIEKNGEFE